MCNCKRLIAEFHCRDFNTAKGNLQRLLVYRGNGAITYQCSSRSGVALSLGYLGGKAEWLLPRCDAGLETDALINSVSEILKQECRSVELIERSVEPTSAT